MFSPSNFWATKQTKNRDKKKTLPIHKNFNILTDLTIAVVTLLKKRPNRLLRTHINPPPVHLRRRHRQNRRPSLLVPRHIRRLQNLSRIARRSAALVPPVLRRRNLAEETSVSKARRATDPRTLDRHLLNSRVQICGIVQSRERERERVSMRKKKRAG